MRIARKELPAEMKAVISYNHGTPVKADGQLSLFTGGRRPFAQSSLAQTPSVLYD
jgi:hypothetical protein